MRHEQHRDRDERLGAAIRGLPVPDHEPGFWAALNHRLDDEAGTGGQPAVRPDPNPTRRPGPDLTPRTDPSSTGPPDPIDLTPSSGPTRRPGPTAAAGVRAPIQLGTERARRRPRFPAMAAAAAAVVVVAATAGVLQFVNVSADGDAEVLTADRPDAPLPEAVTVGYVVSDGRYEVSATTSVYEVTRAIDGSYRIERPSTPGLDSSVEAYAASARRVSFKGNFEGQTTVYIESDTPAGGPGAARLFDETAPYVIGLARAGDGRVTEVEMLDRSAWRYEGPYAGDMLGGDPVPDHVTAVVDQRTGLLLLEELRAGDEVIKRLEAQSFEPGAADPARFHPAPPPGVEPTTDSKGFAQRSLDEVAAEAGYDLLVPGAVPDGFRLDAVTFDRDIPAHTGAEAGNPAPDHVVALRWSDGYRALSVTLRPELGDPEAQADGAIWTDPFGSEGSVAPTESVTLALSGRPPLEGELVVAAPFVPHLWGITGGIVVTVDGDLSPEELKAVAASLEAHRPR